MLQVYNKVSAAFCQVFLSYNYKLFTITGGRVDQAAVNPDLPILFNVRS